MKKLLSATVSLALAAMPAFAAQSAGNSQDNQAQPPAATHPASRFVLEDGTPIKLVLGETISSADAVVGQLVSFEVVEDILVDGVVVVPKGGTAWATVTAAEHLGSDTFLYIDVPQTAGITARAIGELGLKQGDQVRLTPDPARIHRFDSQGRALRQ